MTQLLRALSIQLLWTQRDEWLLNADPKDSSQYTRHISLIDGCISKSLQFLVDVVGVNASGAIVENRSTRRLVEKNMQAKDKTLLLCWQIHYLCLEVFKLRLKYLANTNVKHLKNSDESNRLLNKQSIEKMTKVIELFGQITPQTEDLASHFLQPFAEKDPVVSTRMHNGKPYQVATFYFGEGNKAQCRVWNLCKHPRQFAAMACAVRLDYILSYCGGKLKAFTHPEYGSGKLLGYALQGNSFDSGVAYLHYLAAEFAFDLAGQYEQKELKPPEDLYGLCFDQAIRAANSALVGDSNRPIYIYVAITALGQMIILEPWQIAQRWGQYYNISGQASQPATAMVDGQMRYVYQDVNKEGLKFMTRIMKKLMQAADDLAKADPHAEVYRDSIQSNRTDAENAFKLIERHAALQKAFLKSALKCYCCGKTAEQAGCAELKKCSNCKVANYCGRECQLADWKAEHKEKCAKYKSGELDPVEDRGGNIAEARSAEITVSVGGDCTLEYIDVPKEQIEEQTKLVHKR